MKDGIFLILVIITILFLVFLGPLIFLGLWMEFNPNNFKTEEVGVRVKETLQEKYGEKFVVDKIEYDSGRNAFVSEVYPEKKRYLKFETYVPGKDGEVYEDYQLKKKADSYLNTRFNQDQYYYEIYSGTTIQTIPEDIKNDEWIFQLFLVTVEDKVAKEEAILQLDELNAELKKDGFADISLDFIVIKQPYPLKKLAKGIAQESFYDFLEDSQNEIEFALKCEYSSWESDLPFSSTCKNFE